MRPTKVLKTRYLGTLGTLVPSVPSVPRYPRYPRTLGSLGSSVPSVPSYPRFPRFLGTYPAEVKNTLPVPPQYMWGILGKGGKGEGTYPTYPQFLYICIYIKPRLLLNILYFIFFSLNPFRRAPKERAVFRSLFSFYAGGVAPPDKFFN